MWVVLGQSVRNVNLMQLCLEMKEVKLQKYLFHISFRHINVSIHLLKVLLCPVGLLAVPLEPPLTLQKGTGKSLSRMAKNQTHKNKREKKKV